MRNEKTKRMVGLSLMMAIIVVLQLMGAFIHIGPVSISLVLVPIVIGACVYGPSGGAVLGGAFGVIATICCMNGMDAGGQMVFQANPVLCILVVMGKGILAGLASGFVYKLLKNKNGYLAVLCAAVVCPVVNTGVFLICMALFFMDVLTVWAAGSPVLAYVISGLVVMNFLPELGINVIFTPATHQIVKVAARK